MLDTSHQLEMQVMLARQFGHLTRSGLGEEAALQRLREATDGELRRGVDHLERQLRGGEEVTRDHRRVPGPLRTLGRLAAVAERHGAYRAAVFARAEEVLGPMGESYLAYWAGVSAFLWYVLSLFVMLFIMLVIFSIFVFPQIEAFFDAGPDRTLTTVNALRAFSVVAFPVVVAGVFAMILAARRIRNSMRRLEPIGGLMGRVPVLASLCESYNVALSVNLARLLVAAGVGPEDALDETTRLFSGHGAHGGEMVSAKGRVDGQVGSDPVKGSLQLARRTGTLSEELEHLSTTAQALFAGQLSRVREQFTLTAQILVGIVIAAVLVGMYLPLFRMGDLL